MNLRVIDRDRTMQVILKTTEDLAMERAEATKQLADIVEVRDMAFRTGAINMQKAVARWFIAEGRYEDALFVLGMAPPPLPYKVMPLPAAAPTEKPNA